MPSHRLPMLPPVAVALAAALAGCGGGDRVAQVRPVVLAAGDPVVKRPPAAPRAQTPPPAPPAVGRSRAIGRPNDGRLEGGVLLAAEGPDHLTWDGPLKRTPSRAWRRWGTDRLVATVLRVLHDVRAAHPGAPRILVGDLSRPRGGVFDRRYGGLGHASHQNGLDVDVFYPRRDRRPLPPRHHRQVDRRLAQALVDGFRAAGARFVFVGFRTPVTGPPDAVQRIAHHEDHLHVRIRP